MERINGYLNLTDKEKIEGKETSFGHHKGSWFYILDNAYYFKVEKSDKQIFYEVFSSVLAKYVNIPSVSYDFAIYNNDKGVLSENYNSKHEFEISLFQVVMNFYKKQMKNNDLYSNSFGKINNLEIIWEALMYYFHSYSNRDKIVYDIMYNLVNSFILQCLTGNADFNLSNMVIVNKEEPTLAPNFDYGTSGVILPKNGYRYQMNMEPKINSSYETIYNFLASSDEEYIALFKEKVSLLPDVNEIFSFVQNNYHIEISLEIKDSYTKWYKQNKEELEKVILDFEQIRKRN